MNVAAFGVSLLLAAVLLPFVVRRIGIGDFGRAGIVIACFAPLQLIGTVLGQSVARELASYGNTGMRTASRVFSAALFMCATAVGTVIVLLFVAWILGGGPNRTVLAVPAGLVTLLLIFSIGWACQQFSLILQAVAIAAQNYGDVALVTLLSAIVNAVFVVLGIRFSPNQSGYLAGLAAGYFASFGLWVLLMRIRYEAASSVARFSKDDVLGILKFGKWQVVTQLAGTVGNQMDRYSLGFLTSVSTVGRYNIAMRVQEVVYMAVLKASEVLFPYFASIGTDDLRRQLRVLATGSFALNTLAACAIAPLIVLADPLVDLWVGTAGTAGTARMLVTLAAAGIVGSSVNVYVGWAMGSGNNLGLAFMSFLGAATTILFTVVLIGFWGESAAGFGALAGAVVMQAVAIRNVGARFGRSASVQTLMACGWPPLLSGLGLTLLMRHLGSHPTETWSALFAWYAALAFAIAIASVCLTALSASGRSAIVLFWNVVSRTAVRSN